MTRRALVSATALALAVPVLVALPSTVARAATASVPRPDHVVIVVEENKALTQIVGNADAPYITSLAQNGANFTSSYAETHPSQPNYIALFSGSMQGLTDDSCPHSWAAPSLGDQLIAAGHTFAGYSESLPSVGYTGCSSGAYARKHAPWVNFPAVPASANQPFTAFPSDYSTLPDVSFVIPNLQNDMHDGTVAQGDAWLQANLDGYVQWAKTHNSLFVLTFDEDDGSSANRIATVFAGQSVVPGDYTETINHYNVLRTLEDAFGLPLLGAAATAAPITDTWTGNRPPVAAFTASCTTTCSFDGSGSSDPDGTITGYQWDFGDGATATGVTATHTYAGPGDYQVTLTVTDDQGTTGSSTRTITSGTTTPFVSDTFQRTVTNGLGSADVGGKWTASGTASLFAVTPGAATLTLPRAGTQLAAYLPAATRTDADVVTRLSVGTVPAGGPVYLTLQGRRVSAGNEYSAKVLVYPDRSVTIRLIRVAGNTETAIAGPIKVPGLTYTAGAPLDVRVQVTGTAPTQLRARTWLDGTTEPTAWALTTTDATAALQSAGAVGMVAYLSSAATNPPVTTTINRISARPTTAANTPPTAAFTSSCTQLSCHFDATSSADPDGPIAGYQWSFGDGATGTGATVDHAFAVAGTYPVTLTVTDGPGATGTVTHSVTATPPPVNQPPTAAFTVACQQLACSFDGSGSTDDESVADWAWTFGDGTSGTGVTTTHSYAAAGSYPVTLTVSDLDHATGTLTKTVTVSTLPAAFVSDTFQRTVAGGWGSADVGGAWTVSGPAGATAVTPGRATMRLAAGAQAVAYLPAVTRSDADVTTSFAVDAVPAGGPVYVTVTGRRVSGGNEYSAKVLVNADASVTIRLIKVVAGTETAIAGPVKVPGLTYTAGAAIAVRLQVTGTSPTTLRARAWAAAGSEPSTWNVSLVDSSAGLQAAGGVQLVTYVSRTVTNGPLTTGFGALAARPTSG